MENTFVQATRILDDHIGKLKKLLIIKNEKFVEDGVIEHLVNSQKNMIFHTDDCSGAAAIEIAWLLKDGYSVSIEIIAKLKEAIYFFTVYMASSL